MQPLHSQRVARRAFVITVKNPVTTGTHDSNLRENVHYDRAKLKIRGT